MELDRALQLNILNQLKSVYPETIDRIKFMNDIDTPHFAGNFLYLKEHWLYICHLPVAFGLEY